MGRMGMCDLPARRDRYLSRVPSLGAPPAISYSSPQSNAVAARPLKTRRCLPSGSRRPLRGRQPDRKRNPVGQRKIGCDKWGKWECETCLATHCSHSLLRESRRGRLLDHLLISSLYRALAFRQKDTTAEAVCDELYLDVSRVLNVSLDKDAVVSEPRRSLAGRDLKPSSSLIVRLKGESGDMWENIG